MEIFSLGHSMRPADEVRTILDSRRFGYLADVRRFPGEKRNPGHGTEATERLCLDLGITHIGLGKELGGARPEGFRDYMSSQGFREGMDRLVDLAKAKPTVVFCREALYFRCHRKYLADELVRSGWTVTHLLDASRSLRHRVGNYRMSARPDQAA